MVQEIYITIQGRVLGARRCICIEGKDCTRDKDRFRKEKDTLTRLGMVTAKWNDH